VGFGIEASVLRSHATKAAQAKASPTATVNINTSGQAAQQVAARRQTPMPGGVTK